MVMDNASRPAPDLSIVIVSYNTRDLTVECIRSTICQTTDTTYELLVVDNHSDDGSADAIEDEFGEQVTLIRSRTNHGFAGANNLAAAQARGRYLLLLNPDTVVLESAIDRLTAFAENHPEAGIWGGRTVFADGTLNPASCWRRMTLWGLFCRALGLARVFESSPVFNPEAYGGWPRDTIRQVDIVSGCFLLIERKLWEDLGGFQPDFFMYGEEADLCLRARRLGARPMITPQASIVHYGGASETVQADKLVRLLKAKAMLIRRHFSGWRRPLALALLAAWPLTRSLLERRSTEPPAEGEEGAAAWTLAWRRRSDWLRTEKRGG